MASPQTEDGHTRIAHELMMAILKARLSAPQMAVVFYIMRMSYGYGKKEAERKLSAAEIARECGNAPRATISHAIRGLVRRDILRLTDAGFWAVNKDYDTWGTASPLAKAEKKLSNPLATTANPLANLANPLAPLHIVKKKEKRKDNWPGFDVFWSLYPNKVDRLDALKVWNTLKPSPELFEKIRAAVQAQSKSEKWTKDGGKYINGPASWLRKEKWNDELKPAIAQRPPEVFVPTVIPEEEQF